MTQETAAPTAPDQEARKWAMLCHLSALVGLLGNGIGFVLGPLVVWLLKKQEHPFIDEQGKEALNFQLTMLGAAIISAFLVLVVVGIFLLLVVAVLAVLFPIIAAVKVNGGESYRYPLSIRLVK